MAPPRESPQPESGGGMADAAAAEAPASAGLLPEIRLGSEGESPALLLAFPDPAAGVPEAPPGGYRDICGQWVLDMSADAYGLTNCHIFLERDGTISSPPDYDQTFRIADSGYAWQAGERSFTASLQMVLKMGPEGSPVPVRMDLAGKGAEDMREVRGTFTAQPSGEAFAFYAQQGAFVMLR